MGRYSRLIWWPSVSRYINRYSADMSAKSWPTYRPTSTDTHVGRHPADTSPPPGRYLTDTWPTLRSFAQFSLLSSIFSIQLRGAFSGSRPFLAFNSSNIHVFFSSYALSSSLLLYTTLITFGSSSIWGLLLLEVRYFRGIKNDIESWYNCVLFLPHGWVFQF